MNVSAIPTLQGLQSRTTRSTAVPPKAASISTLSSGNVSVGQGSFKAMLGSFLDGAGKEGTITMDEMRSFRDSNLQNAGSILSNTLARLGISRDTSLDISLASDNSVAVSGKLSASDRANLQNALSANADFVQSYNAASGVSSTIAAGEVSAKFTAMYAQNAQAAVAKYSGVFDKKWENTLTLRNGIAGLKTS